MLKDHGFRYIASPMCSNCSKEMVWFNMASSTDFLTGFAEFASGYLDGNAIPN